VLPSVRGVRCRDGGGWEGSYSGWGDPYQGWGGYGGARSLRRLA
jgi:hypothetical protein